MWGKRRCRIGLLFLVSPWSCSEQPASAPRQEATSEPERVARFLTQPLEHKEPAAPASAAAPTVTATPAPAPVVAAAAPAAAGANDPLAGLGLGGGGYAPSAAASGKKHKGGD